MEYPDLIVESRTMSAEQIQKDLERDGYEGVETQTLSDSAEPPAPETPTTSAVPPGEPGSAGATGDETHEGDSEPPPPEPQPKPKGEGGFKKKIKSLQAENEELKRRLASMDAAKPDPVAPPAEPAAAEPEPEWEDFAESDNQMAAYTKAYTKWQIREDARIAAESTRTERAKRAEDEAKARSEATQTRWKTEMEKATERAKEAHEDFDQVISNPDMMLSGPMITVIRRSLDGPELAYWLGTHPEETARILEATDATGMDIDSPEYADKLHLAAYELRSIAKGFGTPAPPAPAPARRETRPAPAAPAPTPFPAKATPKPPPPPPVPVGSRGTSRRSLGEMTDDDIRALSPDDYRRLRGEV